MSFAKRITSLKKEEEAINDKFKASAKALGYSDWSFCIHTHFNEPVVSMWEKGDNVKAYHSFIVGEDCAKKRDTGRYEGNWQEAKTVLDEVLGEDFFE